VRVAAVDLDDHALPSEQEIPAPAPQAHLRLGLRQSRPPHDREEELLGFSLGDRRACDVLGDDAAQEPAAWPAVQPVMDFAERKVEVAVLGLVDRPLEQGARSYGELRRLSRRFAPLGGRQNGPVCKP
jgi:hypothetical protein